MSRTSWTVACVGLCVACGNGSKTKGHEAGSAGSAAVAVAWKFDQFVNAPHHRVAVLFAGSDAALVDGSGKVTPRINVGPDEIAAEGNGEIVVLASPQTAHGLDAAGRELWTVARHGGQATSGTSSFANASESGAAVYAMATGKPIYESKDATKRVLFHRPDGYVFADASQLWFVEEATGKERWRHTIPGLGDAALDVAPGSLFVMHPDRTFEEIDYTQAKALANGTCGGKPPSSSAPKKPSQCAGFPEVDLTKDDARTPIRDPWGRGDYYPFAKQLKDTFLVARDPVGRIRWSTAAPLQLESVRGPQTADGGGSEVAFLSGKGEATRMLVFDDRSGKLLFERDLDGEHLVGLTGTCWLVASDRHAACLDARAGTTTWDVKTSSEMAEAWLLHDGEALLADGKPLTLSRIGKDGHRRWQVELPATHLEHATDPDKQGSLWVESNAWHLSDALGIVEMKDGLTVIDLETGKIAKVR